MRSHVARHAVTPDSGSAAPSASLGVHRGAGVRPTPRRSRAGRGIILIRGGPADAAPRRGLRRDGRKRSADRLFTQGAVHDSHGARVVTAPVQCLAEIPRTEVLRVTADLSIAAAALSSAGAVGAYQSAPECDGNGLRP